jgi:hypothetical protein
MNSEKTNQCRLVKRASELVRVEETEIMLAIAQGKGIPYVLNRTSECLIQYLEKGSMKDSYVESELNVINSLIARDYLTTGKKVPKEVIEIISRLNLKLEENKFLPIILHEQTLSLKIKTVKKNKKKKLAGCRGDKPVLPGNV